MANSNAAKKPKAEKPEAKVEEAPVVDNTAELDSLRNSLLKLQDELNAANQRADAAESKLADSKVVPEKGSSDKAAILAHFAELYPEPRKVVAIRRGYFGDKIREVSAKFTLPAGFPDSRWYVNEDAITAEEIKILVEGEKEDDE